MVVVEPESNKTLRVLFCEQHTPMVVHVVVLHSNSFGFS